MHSAHVCISSGPGQGSMIPSAVRETIVTAFTRLQLRQRMRVLRRLLVPVGPMALAVIAGGAFAKYVRQARSPRMLLVPEDAARITPAQVLELARYAEQCKPSALQQVMRVIGRSRTSLPAPSAR